MKFRAMLMAIGSLVTWLVAPVASAGEAAAIPSRIQGFEAWGWQVARDEDLVGVDLNGDEIGRFLRGVADQLTGVPPPCDLAAAHADVDALMAARRARLIAARKQQNLNAATAYFAELKKNPHVEILPSGVGLELTTRGHDPMPKPEQTVTLRYVGRTLAGAEFIQMDPHDLILVPNHVNRGLFDGIQKIGVGGKARLYIPPSLLVGEEEKLGIALGAAVVFDVEVLDVKPTSADDLANSLLPPAPEPAAAPPSGVPVPQLIAAWGWMVAQRTGAWSFELTRDEVKAFTTGLENAMANRVSVRPADAVRAAVPRFVAGERDRVRSARRQKRLEAMNAFFAELKKNPHVVELPDGLRYEIVQPGSGPFPKTGQIVIVDYTGRLLDGTVFDRTDNEPLHIQVGSVIEGFNEGIQKIAKGGQIKLYVPPSIGYGDEDMSGVVSKIPAHSTLLYDIKLLDIQDATDK